MREDKTFPMNGMESTLASQENLVEKGAAFFEAPELPPDWQPPSAAIVYEPTAENVDVPQPTSDDS